MQFPYTVFSLAKGDERFRLAATSIDEGTEATKPYGILSACFSVELSIPGIQAQFSADVTLNSLFSFYRQLARCYDALAGEALLESYTASTGTMMEVCFDASNGHVEIEGLFGIRGTKSKVGFGWTLDQTHIKPQLSVLKHFFDELAAIQGFYDFPY